MARPRAPGANSKPRSRPLRSISTARSRCAEGLFADTQFQWPREGKLTLKAGKASIARCRGAARRRQSLLRSAGHRHPATHDRRLRRHRDRRQGRDRQPHHDPARHHHRRSRRPRLRGHRHRGGADLPAGRRPDPPDGGEVRAGEAARYAGARPNVARLAGTPVGAKLAINGNAGAFRINLQTDAGLVNDALAPGNLPKLATVQTNLSGQIDAADASALMALIGLDGVMSVNKGAGRHQRHRDRTARRPSRCRWRDRRSRPRRYSQRHAAADRQPGRDRKPGAESRRRQSEDGAPDAAGRVHGALRTRRQHRGFQRSRRQGRRHRHQRTAVSRARPAGADRWRDQARGCGPASHHRGGGRRATESQ